MVEISGVVLAFAIVAVVAIRWKIIVGRRPEFVAELTEGRRCVWCKRAIGEGDGIPAGAEDAHKIRGKRRAHLQCELQAAKRHIWYYRVFMTMALAMLVLAVGCMVSDCVAHHQAVWDDVWLWCQIFAAVIWLPLLIRRTAVPWARRVERLAAGLPGEPDG